MSSTWRIFSGAVELELVLRERGYKYGILDITPRIHGYRVRALEIKQWLAEYHEPVERFCAVDDDSDAFIEGHFVQTKNRTD